MNLHDVVVDLVMGREVVKMIMREVVEEAKDKAITEIPLGHGHRAALAFLDHTAHYETDKDPGVEDALSAANRVSDRLTGERDAARAALSSLAGAAVEYMAASCFLLEGHDLEHAERALDRLRERAKVAQKIARGGT